MHFPLPFAESETGLYFPEILILTCFSIFFLLGTLNHLKEYFLAPKNNTFIPQRDKIKQVQVIPMEYEFATNFIMILCHFGGLSEGFS